jgi:hypothetical protein
LICICGDVCLDPTEDIEEHDPFLVPRIALRENLQENIRMYLMVCLTVSQNDQRPNSVGPARYFPAPSTAFKSQPVVPAANAGKAPVIITLTDGLGLGVEITGPWDFLGPDFAVHRTI